jgi:hypothetical protein
MSNKQSEIHRLSDNHTEKIDSLHRNKQLKTLDFEPINFPTSPINDETFDNIENNKPTITNQTNLDHISNYFNKFIKDHPLYSEPLTNPNPNQKGIMSSQSSSSKVTFQKELDTNKKIFQETINLTEEILDENNPHEEPNEPDTEDEPMHDANPWIHSTYKNFLTYALPKLPFICREPFKFFWNNLVKIKTKKLEIDQLEEEINEDRVKQARKVKAPKFQYSKGLEKIDFSEFEIKQTKELNNIYVENSKTHINKLYKDHINQLESFVTSITRKPDIIENTDEFPFKLYRTFNNHFREAENTFLDLYCEGLIILNNCLEKNEQKRKEKLAKGRQTITTTLNEVMTERIKSQIGVFLNKNNLKTMEDLERKTFPGKTKPKPKTKPKSRSKSRNSSKNRSKSRNPPNKKVAPKHHNHSYKNCRNKQAHFQKAMTTTWQKPSTLKSTSTLRSTTQRTSSRGRSRSQNNTSRRSSTTRGRSRSRR